jgi:hypothetical protein
MIETRSQQSAGNGTGRDGGIESFAPRGLKSGEGGGERVEALAAGLAAGEMRANVCVFRRRQFAVEVQDQIAIGDMGFAALHQNLRRNSAQARKGAPGA